MSREMSVSPAAAAEDMTAVVKCDDDDDDDNKLAQLAACDVYSSDEERTITAAFAPLAMAHGLLLQQIARLQSARNAANALRAAEVPFDITCTNQHALPPLLQSLGTAYAQACGASSILLHEINKYIQVLLMRITVERMSVFAQLSKVPAPAPVTAATQGPPERCHARCSLNISFNPSGVLSRQRCCAAVVCSACLFQHNFYHSDRGRLLHAACFNCGRLRGVYRKQVESSRPPTPTSE